MVALSPPSSYPWQFPPLCLKQSFSDLGQPEPVLGYSISDLGQPAPVLGYSISDLGQPEEKLIGDWLSCSGRKHRAFDQSGPLCYLRIKYLSHLRRFDSSPPKVGAKLKVCFSSTPLSLNVQTITSVSPPLMCCQPPPLP